MSQSVYYAKNIAASLAGANTVTLSFNAAVASPGIRILEYSGIDPLNPLDVSAAATGNSSTSASGALLTTNPMDLLVGANVVWTGTTAPGSGFTQRLITSPDATSLKTASSLPPVPTAPARPSAVQGASGVVVSLGAFPPIVLVVVVVLVLDFYWWGTGMQLIPRNPQR